MGSKVDGHCLRKWMLSFTSPRLSEWFWCRVILGCQWSSTTHGVQVGRSTWFSLIGWNCC